MWSLLLNAKLSYCYGITAKFVLPHPNYVVDNTLVQQFYRCPSTDHHLSLLLWLRNYHMSIKKSRSHLPVFIGIQILSLFNPIYFFQMLLLHFPYTALDAILPDQSHSCIVPEQVLYVKQAMHLIPHMFHPHIFQSHLRLKDKSSYIHTALSYLQSLKDLLTANALHVLPPPCSAVMTEQVHTSSFTLQGQQLALFHTFKLFLPARHHYYNTQLASDINLKQVFLITGRPGTG